MAATTQGTQGTPRQIPPRPKDTLLEVRRIFKRIEALDDEGVKLVLVLLDGLRAKFEAGKEG